jgi:hypothetical protein
MILVCLATSRMISAFIRSVQFGERVAAPEIFLSGFDGLTPITFRTGISSFTAPVLLAIRPAKLSRRDANDLTELAGHVTLVRKPYRQCDLRQ